MGRVLIIGAGTETERRLRQALWEGDSLVDATSEPDDLPRLVRSGRFNCILVCDAPPRFDALSVCAAVRRMSFVPLVVLMDAPGDDRATRALEIGADEVIPVQVGSRRLLAHIRAVLRGRGPYSSATAGGPIRVGGLTVDRTRREATVSGCVIPLTRTEYRILEYLAERAGEAVERNRMFEDVWGYDADLSGKLLEVHIRRLRAKIEPDPRWPIYLLTVRGYGYRLADPSEIAPES